MVTETAPKEPEVDTPSGRAGGPRIIETVPKTPEADVPKRYVVSKTTIFKSWPIRKTVPTRNPIPEVGKLSNCNPSATNGVGESSWLKYNSKIRNA